MKRNKYIKNLEREKLRLRVQQLELEKQIRRDWKELKTDLTPRNFISSKLEEATHKKPEGSMAAELINYGVSYLSHRFSEKAGQGFEAVIQKGIDKLTGKLNPGRKKK